MQQIQVNLGDRSYPIHIGLDLLKQQQTFQSLQSKKVFIVTNDVVAPLYLTQVKAALADCASVDVFVLPDGEKNKDLAHLEQIFSALLEKNYARDTTLLALGGGVIGDMTGFAAACYQRGVPFVQVPTTLLAQVDSSVGGKTAVNHPLGKNMIGAFYQPQCVIIDTQCLHSLPKAEFDAGMAEVIKYGIIWDAEFFLWLENNIAALKALDTQALTYAIAKCCAIKADIVSQDETEQGVRALLNLGHTFGHAIEAQMGYGNWLHGQAVAAGSVLAAKTALALGLLDALSVQRIENLFRAFDLPIDGPQSMAFSDYMRHMRRDKKVLASKIRLILPQAIGQAGIYSDVDEALLAQVINPS
ncbi:3-dehydroquinate synthase [Shewanella denitrificans OS217]|jgi:3-dehydroquinate synthase|uniref:3-dehydroquinate synthase n=1 Tax=Shewanella denitrificans (strain OS217 / ATCC BAA-1090 / DSM 15013) TaxID=318161 RepID=AROB_SHEDO|nr:3-dehydroquinate synthase [Shewanella denitrificans]Q12SL8.1 RecName: Full=3-dehydroquinate synthase; Short=DHQS [Shewanella denitrificans OS217]ABE53558.1 3-dehydroquinate synthase [Shewanella denitrificans OS217]